MGKATPPPTGPAHADLLQVLVLDILKVGQAGDVEVVAEAQEVLLELHLKLLNQDPEVATREHLPSQTTL